MMLSHCATSIENSSHNQTNQKDRSDTNRESFLNPREYVIIAGLDAAPTTIRHCLIAVFLAIGAGWAARKRDALRWV
jgi:hypothetical protein